MWRSEDNSEESIFCFYLYLDSGDQTWVAGLVSVKQLSPVEHRASTHVPFMSNLDLGFKHLTHKESEDQRGKATDQPEHHTQQSRHPSVSRLPSPPAMAISSWYRVAGGISQICGLLWSKGQPHHGTNTENYWTSQFLFEALCIFLCRWWNSYLSSMVSPKEMMCRRGEVTATCRLSL